MVNEHAEVFLLYSKTGIIDGIWKKVHCFGF